MIAPMRRFLIVLFGLAFLVRAETAAHEPRDRIPLEWKRDPRFAMRNDDTAAPPPPDLPAELAVPATGQGAGIEPSRIARPPGSVSGLEDLAERAADDIAREAARVWGWREYWRAGFARGVTAALDDRRLGLRDHEEGMRFGRLDPKVRPLGEHLAKEAADGAATAEAGDRVRQQFKDLTRSPERDRARTIPGHETAPRFDGPWAMAPVLDEVFASYPLTRTPGLSRDGRRELDAWRIEPAYLAGRDRSDRAYDTRWRDPEFAFSVWCDRQRPGSPWSRGSPADRERFRRVFLDRFQNVLASIDLRPTYAAWRVGFDDGWRYGAAIQAEWAYRRGYAEGFDLGVREAAEIAYPYVYDRAYVAAYDDSFDSWWHTAHPGIDAVRIEDESGDGVFEPGERVLIDVDVLNFGGGEGTFDLIASGAQLGSPSSTKVTFAGRGRKPGSEKVSLRVRDSAPLRTRTAVTVVLTDARQDVPLIVSRPFAIESAPAIDADRIGGRVTISVAVSNTSRRDARATLSVVSLTGGGDPGPYDLGVVPPGASREASFTFKGIHPLDLIGGTSRWRASVARGDTVDDVREVRIDPVATDLTNPDLLDFMLAMADTASVSRGDVEDVRALMMERLRADWARAAAASGNPYKRDFDSQGTETVLGELVRATHQGKRSFASPQVFDRLEADIDALADDLPGPHPLLRKWMKKLAGRVT